MFRTRGKSKTHPKDLNRLFIFHFGTRSPAFLLEPRLNLTQPSRSLKRKEKNLKSIRHLFWRSVDVPILEKRANHACQRDYQSPQTSSALKFLHFLAHFTNHLAPTNRLKHQLGFFENHLHILKFYRHIRSGISNYPHG